MKILVAILFIFSVLEAKISVSVSVIPQVFFVKKIAGDLADVNIMVDKGKSPESYEPTIKQLKDLSKSSLYFNVGMPFEKAWLDRFRAVNPNMQIIPPLKDGELESYMKTYHIDSSHDSEDSHHHGEDSHSPHIWLSFILSKAHAIEIANAFIKQDSKNAAIYKQNLDKFLGEIDEAYLHYKNIFKDNKKAFLVYHPAFEYLASELGIREFAIEQDGKEAKISHTKEILDLVKKHNISSIFIQPQFSKKSAEAIAREANLSIKVADPLSYDWLNNIKNILDEIIKE